MNDSSKQELIIATPMGKISGVAIASAIAEHGLVEFVRNYEELNGAFGRYRNHDADTLSDSKNDIEAIQEWVNDRGRGSEKTRKSYLKEAERLLSWAAMEKSKPLSSLTKNDLLEYEEFLRNPVSKHSGVTWVSPQDIDSVTGQTSNRRYRRTHPDWRPFLKPLDESSVHTAMIIIKSMYGYWRDSGYVSLNPLQLRKASFKPDRDQVINRSLSVPEWSFLFDFIQGMADRIPDSTTPEARLSLLRLANQAKMIFGSLYLLGARISELASIKMSDFELRHGADRKAQYWLSIKGKGGKTRRIPVANDLIKLNKEYRTVINSFPTARDKAAIKRTLVPSKKDDSNLILSASGTKGVTPATIHSVVKKVVAMAVEHYQDTEENSVDGGEIDIHHLAQSSAHWFRHTAATHQSLNGVSTRHTKEFLGHSNYETTLIYTHVDDELMHKEIQASKLNKRIE